MKRVRFFSLAFLCFACIVAGQSNIARLDFDAASVKLSEKHYVRGVSGKLKGGPGTDDPGRIRFTYVSLDALLTRAWNIEDDQIFGPDWLSTPRYTVEATMPSETTEKQFRVMLQSLLIDRFKIKFHHETKTFPGYELALATGGPKLKAPADPDAPPPTTGANGELDAGGFLIMPPGHGEGVAVGNGVYAKFQSYTMSEFVSGRVRMFINQSTGQARVQVIDKTGLTGRYDFTLKFDGRADTIERSVRVGAAVSADATPEDGSHAGSNLPTLFKAVQEQLGLRLIKTAGVPLDSLVIDQIQQVPTEN